MLQLLRLACLCRFLCENQRGSSARFKTQTSLLSTTRQNSPISLVSSSLVEFSFPRPHIPFPIRQHLHSSRRFQSWSRAKSEPRHTVRVLRQSPRPSFASQVFYDNPADMFRQSSRHDAGIFIISAPLAGPQNQQVVSHVCNHDRQMVDMLIYRGAPQDSIGIDNGKFTDGNASGGPEVVIVFLRHPHPKTVHLVQEQHQNGKMAPRGYMQAFPEVDAPA